MMQRETDNSSRTNAKEKQMKLYDKIIDIFVEQKYKRDLNHQIQNQYWNY